ncbi:hypothetical protein [Amphibacillus sediminis]|uniref:hypothetical protein n=1 Tax=Amphibacillus sediminis TaxID=360185 RepID=UPI0008342DC7|nr:hypothetical protein [Amphibacillus sediminis]
MKKSIKIIGAVALSLGLLAACGEDTDDQIENPNIQDPATPPNDDLDNDLEDPGMDMEQDPANENTN